MKTIVAAVDFSAVTKPVLAVATDFARALDARVLLLNVVPVPVVMAAAQLSEEEAAQFMAATEKDAGRRLEELAKGMAGVASETLTVSGVPANEITREARENAADFIVMGSHGHAALYELIVGGTARGVLKNASCPVLIVPASR